VTLIDHAEVKEIPSRRAAFYTMAHSN